LPKFLKGFVNPRTRVTDRTKFMWLKSPLKN
jgi:hypothetical protein